MHYRSLVKAIGLINKLYRMRSRCPSSNYLSIRSNTPCIQESRKTIKCTPCQGQQQMHVQMTTGILRQWCHSRITRSTETTIWATTNQRSMAVQMGQLETIWWTILWHKRSNNSFRNSHRHNRHYPTGERQMPSSPQIPTILRKIVEMNTWRMLLCSIATTTISMRSRGRAKWKHFKMLAQFSPMLPTSITMEHVMSSKILRERYQIAWLTFPSIRCAFEASIDEVITLVCTWSF